MCLLHAGQIPWSVGISLTTLFPLQVNLTHLPWAPPITRDNLKGSLHLHQKYPVEGCTPSLEIHSVIGYSLYAECCLGTGDSVLDKADQASADSWLSLGQRPQYSLLTLGYSPLALCPALMHSWPCTLTHTVQRGSSSLNFLYQLNTDLLPDPAQMLFFSCRISQAKLISLFLVPVSTSVVIMAFLPFWLTV